MAGAKISTPDAANCIMQNQSFQFCKVPASRSFPSGVTTDSLSNALIDWQYDHVLPSGLWAYFQARNFAAFDMAFYRCAIWGMQFEIGSPIHRPRRQKLNALPIALHQH